MVAWAQEQDRGHVHHEFGRAVVVYDATDMPKVVPPDGKNRGPGSLPSGLYTHTMACSVSRTAFTDPHRLARTVYVLWHISTYVRRIDCKRVLKSLMKVVIK
jgi:hypothetical protein